MKLVEYTTFEEKKPFFNNGDLKVKVNLEKVFDEIKKFQKIGDLFIYRGCSEAKYQMYNSAQRIYINQELHFQVPEDRISEHYRLYITKTIEACKSWNNGVVKSLLKSYGIDENNSLAYLSFMQHYGVPTPFLDFSFDPYVALFFAVDKINYTPSENEIDNYFSLYYTYTSATAFKSWMHVFDNNIKKMDISYETIDNNNMSILLPENELYQIINSSYIINQKGLFLYNNHPWYPLERTYTEYIDFMKNEIGQVKFDKLLMHDTIAGCFNIHKSLVPAIKDRLKKLGITKNYIYPDMNDFKESVTNDGVLNSLTLKK